MATDDVHVEKVLRFGLASQFIGNSHSPPSCGGPVWSIREAFSFP